MTSDPFDVLGLPPVPLAPDPTFAARLRARVRAELAGLSPRPRLEEPMTDLTAAATASPLVPYLCADDAARAIDWYVEVLGAVETLRYAGPDGRVGHAELAIGTARVMLADPFPEIGVTSPAGLGGTSVSLYLEVVDVDYTHERAVHAGARSDRPPADQDHGHRTAVIVDPFGHRWMLSQPIGSVAPDQADRAAGTEWTISGRPPVEVGYLTIPTDDRERAAVFLRSVLGWDVDPVGGHVGNTRLPMGIATPATNGESVVLYFRIDDPAHYEAAVVAAGGQVLERNDHPSGLDLRCVDDQGREFHLWRPGPGY